MIALFRRLTSSIIIPLSWTLLVVILLCLPGSAFPGGGIFSISHLDKLIHITLFGGTALFWCLYYNARIETVRKWRFVIASIALFTIAFGICMEYIQLYFIANRAFDLDDIIANSAGIIAVTAFLFFKKP